MFPAFRCFVRGHFGICNDLDGCLYHVVFDDKSDGWFERFEILDVDTFLEISDFDEQYFDEVE